MGHPDQRNSHMSEQKELTVAERLRATAATGMNASLSPQQCLALAKAIEQSDEYVAKADELVEITDRLFAKSKVLLLLSAFMFAGATGSVLLRILT